MGNDKRASTPAGRALARTRVRPKASWSWLTDDHTADMVHHMEGFGGAIMFSKTRDGGALSLTLYLGDAMVKKYPQTPVDLWFDLVDAFTELQIEAPAWLDASEPGSI